MGTFQRFQTGLGICSTSDFTKDPEAGATGEESLIIIPGLGCWKVV